VSNFSYKNIDDILLAKGPIRGTRFTPISLRRKLVVPVLDAPTSQFFEYPDASLELHAFLPTTAYVDGASLYDIPFTTKTVNETVVIDNVQTIVERKYVVLDIHRHAHEFLKLPVGEYKFVYNFFRNLVGDPQTDLYRLFISDISSDRREIKLSLKYAANEEAISRLSDFVLTYLSSTTYLPTTVLNFGENLLVDVINITSDGDNTYFYAKLYEPLPADVDIYYECWLGNQILKPWIENVSVRREEGEGKIPYISGPNFEVDYNYWLSTETDYKSWNDLLSTNVQTSQELLNRYVFDSGSSTKLNVDFREFSNFIFYSSAEDRVANFFYKLGLIENYNTQLVLLSTYTGSVDANVIKVKNLRDKVIGGFDDFEKWMYYETTGSNYYTYQNTSTVTPYPKYELDVTASTYDISTKEGKYNLYSTLSEQGQNWYDNLINSASNYDLKNYNSLDKSIPEFIRDDKDNEQFTTFVNMIGQHFDIMYLYTDHLLRKTTRKENPKDGLSQDLIYETTRNLGWTLSHGTQAKDLWEYALGVSGSGEPIWTGKTTTNKYLAKSEEERTKEVWRRILNNLPYIYKTKGTARGIRALLSAYGIPQTLLSIREYGGPDNADLGEVPRTQWEKYTNYLNFSGSYPLPTTNRYVRVPWEEVNNESGSWQYPDTLTFRWKMEPNRRYSYNLDPVQTVLQKQSGSRVDWFVTANKNGTDIEKGSITLYMGDGTNYKSASIQDDYFYDDVPLNLMIKRRYASDDTSSNQIYDFIVKTEKYGKIVIERSASIVVSGSTEPNYNRAWTSRGQLYIGSGSNPQTSNILSGSIFELRYWTRQLNETSFDNHVLSARAYNGNTPSSSFYDLQAQWKFWQKFDVAVTTSLASSHPDQSKNTFYSSSKNAYFYGFDSGAFEGFIETYNMEIVTAGNNTPFTEKVRIDSASLLAPIKVDESFAVSKFDKFSIDSNKLMVAFSPNHIINEDIYEALGYTTLDDYFGEYSAVNSDEYVNLKRFAREYWQKYPNKNDFTAYIRLISKFDFSVFDQIRQTLPIRTNEILGVVVEPNVLERSKVKVNRDFTAKNATVVDTNALDKAPKPAVSISRKKSTLLIGFEENFGSNITNVEGEYDIESNFNVVVDDIEGDRDIKTEVKSKVQMRAKAKITPKLKKIDTQYKPTIKTKLQSTFKTISPEINTIQASVITKPSKIKVQSGMFYSPTGILSTIPLISNKIDIENLISIGYNAKERKTAYYQQIENHRYDGYYKKFDPRYATISSYNTAEPTSYEQISTDYIKPNNLPTGVRNHRYLGTKLRGKNNEAINQDCIPAVTPDGGPVVVVITSNLDTDIEFNIQ